jgi:CDP-4-dehydro-6-deoxyglucose reductase, E1
MINLVNDTIDNRDIDQLIEWLKTYPRLTKGPKTVEFEKLWAEFLGTSDSVFVNSGSSAILVALQTLIETGRLKKGDNIIVPALSWATDLSSVVHLGLTPVLCDCNLEDLSIDLDHFEYLCQDCDISGLILVSVLGIVPNMERVAALCKKYNVCLLEDACESFGSKYESKNIGTFGLVSTFSTYFGHHLSTIEGGLLCTNDTDLAADARCVRNHGWDRDYPEEKKEALRKEHNISVFDSLYTFYMHGFNVRSTDLQAFIGIEQIKKASAVNQQREQNFLLYQELLKNNYWKPLYRENTFCSNFAYPIIHPKRNEIVEALSENKIECRPMICRQMGAQPFYIKLYGSKILKNSAIVDKFGMYVPNHPQLKYEEVVQVCEIVNRVIKD